MLSRERGVASSASDFAGRCAEEPPPLLLEGVALFNRGLFFECHEVLEVLWRAEPGAVRALYQGILQVGVGYHHLLRGNWRGAVSLLERGLARLRHFPPRCQGVDVARLIRESEHCRAELGRLGAEHLSAFDTRLVPRVYVRRKRRSAVSPLDGK